MADFLGLDALRQVIASSLRQLGNNLVAFFPTLVATLALLLVGWGVSKLVEVVSRRALLRVGLDRVSARFNLPDTLNRAGIVAPPSRIVSGVLFWIVMMTFALSAAETLGLSAAASTIDRLVAYLPNVIASGLLIFLGFLLSRLVRGIVASGAIAADAARAQRIGAAVGGFIFLLIAVLALEQLGLQTTLLVVLVTVLAGGAALTLGFAFAIGARPVVSHILAGHFLRQSLTPGAIIEVDGRKGRVERVGSVDTLLKDAEQAWSIPNGALLDRVILR